MDDALSVNSPSNTGKSSLLHAESISKGFTNSRARIQVLDHLDIRLQAGETLAVIGASGIGKSTLLHILGTLDRPDSGALYFKGTNVLDYGDERLARFRNRAVGFVFQFHHLLSEFSAIENTMMPALIQGIDRKTARQAAEAILVRVGLQDRLEHQASHLSGGEQQRVALARALVLSPALLLADEPTGNLDKKNSEQVHQLMLELNREMGMTLVVVTHNPELAALMGRQATIVDGKLAYMTTNKTY